MAWAIALSWCCAVPWRLGAQDLRIIGFLEVPQLFGGWTPDWEPVPREPGFQLLLRTAPSPEASTVARIASSERIERGEFAYEGVGARVFGRSGGWSLLRTIDGKKGWAEPREGWRFHSLEHLLLEGLTYLTSDFDGVLYRRPEGGGTIEIPGDPRRRIVGVLEPRPPTLVRIPLRPGDNPDSVRMSYGASASRIDTLPDGSRALELQTGVAHRLFDAPEPGARTVGDVAASRPSSSVFVTGGPEMQNGVLVFDTRPGWFQVAREWYDWREAPRAWLRDDPDWTFHPVTDPAESEALAERAFGPRTLSVRVLEVERVGEDLWGRVGVHFDSPCLGAEEPEVIAEGWVPLHGPSGAPNLWFYSRGC